MNYTPLNYFGIIFCMMVGTASLPHILMRYFTTPVGEGSAGFGGVVAAVHLPALLLGAGLCGVLEARGLHQHHRQRPQGHPSLAVPWGELGLIQICGKNAVNLQAVLDACKAIAGHPGVLRFQDFVINTDVIVLSTPEIAGLPYVISGLVAAGGLAAALSTADGLLLAIANALSHDIYYKMIDPNAPTIRRLTVARVLLFFVAVDLGRAGSHQAVGHPGHGGVGVLARHGRQLPGAGARHLVETHHHAGRDRGSSPGWGSACSTSSPRGISRRPGSTISACRRCSIRRRGQPLINVGAAPGRSEMGCRRARERGQPDGQPGRLVRPQQHQLRPASACRSASW